MSRYYRTSLKLLSAATVCRRRRALCARVILPHSRSTLFCLALFRRLGVISHFEVVPAAVLGRINAPTLAVKTFDLYPGKLGSAPGVCAAALKRQRPNDRPATLLQVLSLLTRSQGSVALLSTPRGLKDAYSAAKLRQGGIPLYMLRASL